MCDVTPTSPPSGALTATHCPPRYFEQGKARVDSLEDKAAYARAALERERARVEALEAAAAGARAALEAERARVSSLRALAAEDSAKSAAAAKRAEARVLKACTPSPSTPFRSF